MSRRPEQEVNGRRPGRRGFTPEFKEEAVRMLLDGHTARSVCERLGISGTNLLYRRVPLLNGSAFSSVSVDFREKALLTLSCQQWHPAKVNLPSKSGRKSVRAARRSRLKLYFRLREAR